MVPDPLDPTKKVKRNKLLVLLQVPVRELHNNLLKEVPGCTVDGNSLLVSDWTLRKLLPPEVRRMSNYCKTSMSACCVVCVQMKLHQSTYNRFKGQVVAATETVGGWFETGIKKQRNCL